MRVKIPWVVVAAAAIVVELVVLRFGNVVISPHVTFDA